MFKKDLSSNKRGSGHLEMIFSFVFFIGFVFFLFLLLKPYDTKSMLESLNKGLADSFEKNTSTNLTTFFFANDTELPAGCFYINLSNESELFETGFSNSLVKDISDNKINSTLSPEGILKISTNPPSNYFKVSVSPDFEEDNLGSCNNLTNYKMGNILNRRILSYQFLVGLNESYSNNYEGVKKSLGVPGVYEFAVISKDLPEINMDISRNTLISSEVFTRSYYFNVLKTDGSIINSEFILKVW